MIKKPPFESGLYYRPRSQESLIALLERSFRFFCVWLNAFQLARARSPARSSANNHAVFCFFDVHRYMRCFNERKKAVRRSDPYTPTKSNNQHATQSFEDRGATEGWGTSAKRRKYKGKKTIMCLFSPKQTKSEYHARTRMSAINPKKKIDHGSTCKPTSSRRN